MKTNNSKNFAKKLLNFANDSGNAKHHKDNYLLNKEALKLKKSFDYFSKDLKKPEPKPEAKPEPKPEAKPQKIPKKEIASEAVKIQKELPRKRLDIRV